MGVRPVSLPCGHPCPTCLAAEVERLTALVNQGQVREALLERLVRKLEREARESAGRARDGG